MNVLMIGSSLEVKGGMTTVVEGFLKNNFNKTNLYYIPTHTDGSKLKKMIFFLIALVKILFFLLFKDIAIVHMHFSERGSFTRKNLISKLSKKLKKKVVIHMHGAEFKEFYNESSIKTKKSIEKFLLRADRVLVLGESWNKFVKGINEKIKIEVMPNFVSCIDDTSKFNSNEINILFLAVLIKRKGIFDLVEAVNLIIKEKFLEQFDLNIIVAGSGVELENLKCKVQELGIEKYFEFLGWVKNEEKQEILKKSQLFVLPSYNEGLPVSILEAMSYGIPIISTSVGSIEDAVKNEYNGLIIEPGNINALKESIKAIITNKEKWKYFSENNKKLVEEVYNEKIYFKKIEQIYYTI
ncbi:glycosyltransferase family 4 protein [Paraclostridium bifermentans]|uniref:Glycosyltransferase family 4 protein n=1 Tax=Paraclostridium bifermentans TaxID=1490 RepID=A0AA44DID2_PARBF|nr:glycosyltransferase family 4 protein [Paraclostridium bifermentans]MBN8048018.1 glycosyltransferase family 4 protein [Paraclostridium bifermentans]NME08146.1 glycosyltransferase family 4 protein [Paraclostridium bifermentans]